MHSGCMTYIALSPRASVQYMPYIPRACVITITSLNFIVFCIVLQEAQDMASPAIQLSTRIPDKRLQVWAASLLAGTDSMFVL